MRNMRRENTNGRCCFQCKSFVAHIERFLQSNETLNGCVNRALADLFNARKDRVRVILFQCHGYDCLLPCHSSSSEMFVRRNVEGIDKEKKISRRVPSRTV